MLSIFVKMACLSIDGQGEEAAVSSTRRGHRSSGQSGRASFTVLLKIIFIVLVNSVIKLLNC
jgi:hypothetical protein